MVKGNSQIIVSRFYLFAFPVIIRFGTLHTGNRLSHTMGFCLDVNELSRRVVHLACVKLSDLQLYVWKQLTIEC